VVTNPPFKLAEEFAHQALVLAQKKVALLARIQFLEGMKRQKFFRSTPLARVWVFSKRLTMMNAEGWTGQGTLCFAWFVWDHAFDGKPTLGWLP
jgi:hypothetical protein